MIITFILLLIALFITRKMWMESEDSKEYRSRCLEYEIDGLEEGVTAIRSSPFLNSREKREAVASLEEEIELLKYEMDNIR